MTEQLAITLIAASVGFVAAIFFCVGNVMNTSKAILSQSIPYWDFSEPVARALAAQRAQYVVGALLLVGAFLLQVVAALASPTNPANLPQCIGTWPYLVLSSLVPALAVGAVASWLLYERTIRKVLRLEQKEREEESNKS